MGSEVSSISQRIRHYLKKSSPSDGMCIKRTVCHYAIRTVYSQDMLLTNLEIN